MHRMVLRCEIRIHTPYSTSPQSSQSNYGIRKPLKMGFVKYCQETEIESEKNQQVQDSEFKNVCDESHKESRNGS